MHALRRPVDLPPGRTAPALLLGPLPGRRMARPLEGWRIVKAWACLDCGWQQREHPVFGWSSRDDRAVEVHLEHFCPARPAQTPGQ